MDTVRLADVGPVLVVLFVLPLTPIDRSTQITRLRSALSTGIVDVDVLVRNASRNSFEGSIIPVENAYVTVLYRLGQ
jgi:hypothetical protein